MLRDWILGRGGGWGTWPHCAPLGAWSPPAGFVSLRSRLVSSFLSRGISQESCAESSTQRKGLTWESPWEWWVGGALCWSGRGGCGRTPLWSLETFSTSCWLQSPGAQPGRRGQSFQGVRRGEAYKGRTRVGEGARGNEESRAPGAGSRRFTGRRAGTGLGGGTGLLAAASCLSLVLSLLSPLLSVSLPSPFLS